MSGSTGAADDTLRRPFAISPNQLHRLLANRKASEFHALGGLPGLCLALRTDAKAGILCLDETQPDNVTAGHETPVSNRPGDPDKTSTSRVLPRRSNRPIAADAYHTHLRDVPVKTLSDRQSHFGENILPKAEPKSMLAMVWQAFNNRSMFLLTASALVSLTLGICQMAIGGGKGPNAGWVESATIIGAIIVTVTATAANNYQKNYKFRKLDRRKEERRVMAIRSGKNCHVPVYNVVVGDLLHVGAGDVLCADGVLVEGFQIRCDESHLSGESELVQKITAERYDLDAVADPFLFSGAVVSQGVGTYLVTAVGTHSAAGRAVNSYPEAVDEYHGHKKLDRLIGSVLNIGCIIAVVYFVALFIRWLIQLKGLTGPDAPRVKTMSFLNIVMLAVTIVIVGVPEGLPLALAFATTRMLKDNNLVRLIRSCEVLGTVTTICADKTGTLTRNEMSVVSGVIGCDEKFGPGTGDSMQAAPMVTAHQLTGELAYGVVSLLKECIVLNSTVLETDGPHGGGLVGSSTETALLHFARDRLAMDSIAEERAGAEIVEMFPFNADRKYMAVIIRRSGRYRLLVKGAAEIILANCADTLECTKKNWSPRGGLNVTGMDPEKRERLEAITDALARRLLRPIAMSYRDLDSWPPIAASGFLNSSDDPYTNFDQLFRHQMTFVAMFAVYDPLRPEVIDSIRQCQQGGVFVRMLTGDNLATAEATALESGIFTAGGVAMDGPTFRRLTSDQMDAITPRLQVLARSSADDKAKLVSTLQRLGETVAVTGDGTNDAYALKMADVGFSMGISGTEIAREASSIVLLDDNIASIVKALCWGRVVTDITKKFCQFQFTLNLTAAIITIVSTFVGDINSSIFGVIQLLWLNLIMDILAGFSFATELPRPHLMKRRPEPADSPLITVTMWKMIIGQSVYQLALVFTLYYAGSTFWPDGSAQNAQTVVFNTYMFAQLFNQINCRRVDNGINIFVGLFDTPWFLCIQAITFVGQVSIVLIGGEAFGTAPLTGAQWGWSITFGLFVLLIGAAIRCIPDSWIMASGRLFKPLIQLLNWAWEWKAKRRESNALRQKQKGVASFEAHPQHEASRNQSTHSGWAERLSVLKSRKPHTRPNTNIALGVIGGTTPASPLDGSEVRSEEPFDLFAAVQAAKQNKIDIAVAGLDVHPATAKDDPVLMPLREPKPAQRLIPPSQDEEIMRFVDV